jgi:transcriptional regulator with XRE-family HTH domain
MEQRHNSLAANLQNIRESRNLSLEVLSEMTGVSKSMLRQIEIGQSNPTVATIWKIANGLRLPFTALLRDRNQEITVKSFKQAGPITGDVPGYRIFPMIVFDPERAFETYYLEIDPGITLDAEPHQGNAEEHVFVLRGALEITVGSEPIKVAAENFMGFQANCVHQYRNDGTETMAAIMTISYLP